jgi:VWFA-related protein
MLGVRLNRLISALIVSGLLLSTSVSQTKLQPKRKTKNFGSSLKRMKWDERKNETVLVPSARNATGDADLDVVRIETSLVAWDVLVVDSKGINVQGLTAQDFQVSEDGVPQTVGHFLLGSSQEVPRTIVLVIDYSGSQLPYIRNSIDSAKVLVDSLAPLDRMAIVTDDVELLVDFTNDKRLLKEKLEMLVDRDRRGGFFGLGKERRLGKSQQYSALMATLNEMFDESDQRPIVVFQTDGDEVYRLRDSIIPPQLPPDLPPETRQMFEQYLTHRQQSLILDQTVFSLADVYRTAEKSRATIYTVVPGFRLIGLSPDVQVQRVKEKIERSREALWAKYSPEERAKLKAEQDEKWRPLSPANLRARAVELYKVQLALAAIAPRTGGWTDFLETPEQASTIYSRIFSDINKRYIVGYYPTNKAHDGTRRQIKIEVKGHPEYTLVGRRSYYAPSN